MCEHCNNENCNHDEVSTIKEVEVSGSAAVMNTKIFIVYYTWKTKDPGMRRILVLKSENKETAEKDFIAYIEQNVLPCDITVGFDIIEVDDDAQYILSI